VSETTGDLKRLEEERRERHWDPRLKWQVIQRTISWADRQSTCQRNSKANRLKEEERKLKLLRALSEADSETQHRS